MKFTRIVRAFNESDYDTIAALVSEDCRYYVAGGGILAANTRDAARSESSSARAKAETQDKIAVDLKVATSSDDHVMIDGVVRAERNGKRLESRNIYVYRFGQNGKLAEGMNVPVDQERWTAFWS